MRGAFVDLSQWNADPAQIDWQRYKQWSASGDGISRVCLRACYGNGYKDQHFEAYRAGALRAGIDCILYYSYAYPNFNSPVAEANWMHTVVGDIRPSDIIMLDAEEDCPQATAEWFYAWLMMAQANYPERQIVLYSYPAFIAKHLQDRRLAQFPLYLASWQFDPNATPACPSPWTSYAFLQYTDKATNIPGIPGSVDADVYVGGLPPMTTTIPRGWTDDGRILTAPNGVQVRNGFRAFILATSWNAENYPLGPEYATGQLEMSNPGLGGGTQQMFRFSMLGWNTAVGVIEEWAGQEVFALRTLLKQATSELTTLQAIRSELQTQLTQCQNTLKVTGQQLKEAQTALVASDQQVYATTALAARDMLSALPPYPMVAYGPQTERKVQEDADET